MEASLDLTVNDLTAKFKSKSKLYNVLVREGGIYLPPKQDSTQKFLRSILLGAKLYVKWEEVKIIKVPQYKGLQVRIYWSLLDRRSILASISLITNTARSQIENGCEI